MFIFYCKTFVYILSFKKISILSKASWKQLLLYHYLQVFVFHDIFSMYIDSTIWVQSYKKTWSKQQQKTNVEDSIRLFLKRGNNTSNLFTTVLSKFNKLNCKHGKNFIKQNK